LPTGIKQKIQIEAIKKLSGEYPVGQINGNLLKTDYWEIITTSPVECHSAGDERVYFLYFTTSAGSSFSSE
jgi:hypothetical protein